MRTITIAVACMTLQGCATMLDRSPRRVLVASTPPGAEVFVDGDRVGTTPTSVRPDAGAIRLESGGLTQHVRLSREASPWLWANIPAGFPTALLGFAVGHRLCDECDPGPKLVPAVFASLVPIIVDLMSGRAFRYPWRVHVAFEPPANQSSLQLAHAVRGVGGGSLSRHFGPCGLDQVVSVSSADTERACSPGGGRPYQLYASPKGSSPAAAIAPAGPAAAASR